MQNHTLQILKEFQKHFEQRQCSKNFPSDLVICKLNWDGFSVVFAKIPWMFLYHPAGRDLYVKLISTFSVFEMVSVHTHISTMLPGCGGWGGTYLNHGKMIRNIT